MHAIEQFEDGTAAFYGARTPAWHRLGVITDEAKTAAEAIKLAQLDWDVDVVGPVTVDTPAGPVEIPNKYATVRNHPKLGTTGLGVVGHTYTPIQNVEAFEILTDMADDSELTFDTAGSLNDGRQVFVSMRLPESLVFSNGDTTDIYVLASNSHDGSSSFKLAVTPVRVVCQNTLTVGLRHAQRTFSVRHTTNVKLRANQAREALDLTFKYADEFSKAAELMISTSYTTKQFEDMVGNLFPATTDSSRSQTRAANLRDELMTLWSAPTQENSKHTKWAAYNTIVEWADWYQPVRKAAKAEIDLRALRTMVGGNDQIKERALAYLR